MMGLLCWFTIIMYWKTTLKETQPSRSSAGSEKVHALCLGATICASMYTCVCAWSQTVKRSQNGSRWEAAAYQAIHHNNPSTYEYLAFTSPSPGQGKAACILSVPRVCVLLPHAGQFNTVGAAEVVDGKLLDALWQEQAWRCLRPRDIYTTCTLPDPSVELPTSSITPFHSVRSQSPPYKELKKTANGGTQQRECLAAAAFAHRQNWTLSLKDTNNAKTDVAWSACPAQLTHLGGRSSRPLVLAARGKIKGVVWILRNVWAVTGLIIILIFVYFSTYWQANNNKSHTYIHRRLGDNTVGHHSLPIRGWHPSTACPRPTRKDTGTAFSAPSLGYWFTLQPEWWLK